MKLMKKANTSWQYLRSAIVAIALLAGFQSNAQLYLPECTNDVPLLIVDLSDDPDSVYITPTITRVGSCCSAANQINFISFFATLHPNAAMVEIGIAEGADPSGSGEYHFIDGGDTIIAGTCLPYVPAGDPVCIPPGLVGPDYKIAFGKPGNNANKFFFRQILKPTFPQDDTTRVGCSLPLDIYGLDSVEINSINSSTGETTLGYYNNLLSCTDCEHPYFSPGLSTPEWIDFVICGTQEASTACGVYATCDTVRLYTMDALELSASPNPATFCATQGGVLLTASATGGDGNYSFIWKNSLGDTLSLADTLYATSQGTYTVELTDGLTTGTCPPEYVSVPVTTGGDMIINAGVDQTTCASDPTVFIAGSVDGDDDGGTWSGGLGTYTPSSDSLLITYTPTAAEINAGSVTLYLTANDDDGECWLNDKDQDTIVINYTDSVYVNPFYTPLTCNGDFTTINANASNGTPGYTYSWTTGATTPSIMISAGTFGVTVTDSEGCEASANITVTDPPLLTISMSSTNTSTDLACDGTATVTPGGGVAPYTVEWGDLQTTTTAVGLCYGVHTVTVTDDLGCTITGSVVVNNPSCSLFNVTASNTNVSCYGDTDAEAFSFPTGGTAPYTYSWNTAPVQTTQNASGLSAGTYTVTVIDDLGCIDVANVSVTQPSIITNTMTHLDATSIGGNEGEATANPQGGTPGYTYLWNPTSQITQTATSLTAGTYYVNIQDSEGCLKTDSVLINEPPCNDFMVYVNAKDITCNGLTNGSASIIISQGSAPYSISWSSGETDVTSVTGLAAGSYTVTVTDASNCTTFETFDIEEPDPLSIGLAPTNITCFGANNGTIELTITGGTYPYTYNWISGGASIADHEDLVNLKPGTYSVTVTDANGCSISGSVGIMEPAKLYGTQESTDILCNGDANGSVDATIYGGIMPYSYSWTGPGGYTATTQDISGLDLGLYELEVVDANGCVMDPVVQGYVNEPDTVLIQTYTIPCPVPGADDVVVTIDSISGGAWGSYDVSFDGGSIWQPTGDYDSLLLLNASYDLVARDSNGCMTPLPITITLDPKVEITAVNFNPCIAVGTTDINIIVSSIGGDGGPYEVSTDGGATFNAPGVDTFLLPVGTNYDIVIRDTKGCESTVWPITIPAPFDASAVLTNEVTCLGDSDGSIDLTVTGGTSPYTYAWTGPAAYSSTSEDISGLIAGTYDVTVTDDSSCVATTSIVVTTIVDVTDPVINCMVGNQFEDADNGFCYYTHSGTAWDATATDNCLVSTIEYTLTGATTGTGNTLSGVQFDLGVTTVTWVATDNSGNTDTCTFNVTVSDVELPAITSCGGVGTQSVVADNGVCYYTNTGTGWDATATDNCTVSTIEYALTGVTTGTGTTLDGVTFNLGTTTVTWTVTDGSGNTSTCTFDVEVTDDQLPAITSCGAVGTQNVVADNGVCYYTNTGTGWDATATDNCTVSTIEYALTGATTGSGTTLDGETFNLGTTTVTWTVTDGSGNTATCTFDVEVTDDQLPSITSCGPSGDQTVNANLGTCTYTYSGTGWNATATDNCSVSTIVYAMTGATIGTGTSLNGVSFNLGATLVTWTVTDGSGNTSTCSFTVTVVDDQYPAITSCGAVGTQNVSTDAGVCTYTQTGTGWDATATDNCTVSSILYTLSGATTGSGSSLDGVTFLQGTTTVLWTATDGSGNQTTCTFDVVVTDNEVPSIIGCVTDINQNNDAGSCGAVVNWIAPTFTDNCGASMTSTHNPGDYFPIGTTTVTYTVTDGTGNVSICQFNVTITDSELPAITCQADHVSCDPIFTFTAPTATDNCGVVSVTQTSGLPSGSAFPIGTTTITFEALDVNGNTNTCSFDVIINPTPVLSTSTTDVSCFAAGDGSIDLTVTNGTIPYTYGWSNGATTEDISGLQPGTYNVTVTDVNGCSASTSASITEPAILSLNKIVDQVSCNGGSDGAIDLFVSGGTIPYSYSWAHGPVTGDLTGLSAGSYTVTITDANGCTIVDNTVITEPTAIDIQYVVHTATCNASNGSITAQVTGGTSPYTYLWSNGATTLNLSNVPGDDYTLTVTDNNGCTASISDSVTTTSNIAATVYSEDAQCYGQDNGWAMAIVESGNAPYDYAWSSGDTTIQVGDFVAGSYSVTVTDFFGCVTTVNFDINEPDSLYIDLYTSESIPGYNISPNGGNNGSIQSTVYGGTSPYTYSWTGDNDLIATTADVYGLYAGGYQLTVTDENGCVATAGVRLTEPGVLEMPNGITPNNDGKNDVFDIHGVEAYPDNDITVYNRWGNVVYDYSGYTTEGEWHGQNKNNEELPAGTYYVIFNAYTSDGSTITLTGYCDLRRSR